MDFSTPRWYDSLPSTNATLRALLEADPALPSGSVIAARTQTAGRGQFGRVWVTKPEQDLAFSFLFRGAIDLSWIPSLPMATALAISESLSAFGIHARVKWPNDVLVEGKKICGILVENLPTEGDATIVVGVGLNVNMGEGDAARIGRPATSIRIETGEERTQEEVLQAILGRLPVWMGKWQAGGFPAIRSDWIASAVGIGKNAVIRRPNGDVSGVLEDFGECGELVLKHSDGTRKLIWTGDLDTNGSVA